jgi:hypothetical protein
MSRALLLCLLLGCTREVREQTHTQSVREEQRAEQKQKTVDVVRHEGPTHTVTYEFAPPKEADPAQGASPRAAGPVANSVAPAVPVTGRFPAHGALLRVTVQDTGPAVQETHATATQTAQERETVKVEQRAAVHTETRVAASPWLWLALAGVALVVAGLLVRRFFPML